MRFTEHISGYKYKAATNLAPRPRVNTWISWESCVTPALGLCSRPPLQWTLGFYEQQFPHHQLLSGETKSVMSLLWTVKTRALTLMSRLWQYNGSQIYSV